MGYGPKSSFTSISPDGKQYTVYVTEKGLVVGDPRKAATPADKLPDHAQRSIPPDVKKGH